jgi:LysM domain
VFTFPGSARSRAVPILIGRALQNSYHGFAVYAVKAGDPLSSIAQEFYGDPDRFRTIFQANRNVLDDPDEIFPGQELRIPVMPECARLTRAGAFCRAKHEADGRPAAARR